MNPENFEPSDDYPELARARRRRARRMLTQLRADEREAYLEDLAHIVSPSIELYLLALISGALIGLGFRFDQLVLLVGGALLAPRMGTLTGLSLASVSGSPRFFGRTVIATLISLTLTAVSAGLAGGIGIRTDAGLMLTAGYTGVNLLDFLMLLAGAVLMAVILVREERISPLASTAAAYEILLPLGAAAIGVVTGNADLITGGLLTFGIYTTWATVAGMITLALLGFRPLTGGNHSIAAAIGLMGLIGVLSAAWAGGVCDGFTSHANANTHVYADTHSYGNDYTNAHNNSHAYDNTDCNSNAHTHGQPDTDPASWRRLRNRRNRSYRPRCPRLHGRASRLFI